VSFILCSFLLVTGSAWADYCLSFPPSSAFFVGQGFSLPAKGKCKAFTGFAIITLGGNDPISGTGCVSADGSHLAFTITYTETEAGGGVFNDSATLTLPAQTGTDVETTGASSSTFAVTGGKCHGMTVPTISEGNSTSAPASSGPGTH
jgi:hypothetical protein